MTQKNLGISQQTLVSDTESQFVPSKKLPQYIASLSATLGAIATGLVLGWTSPAGADGINLQTLYGVPISSDEFSWIGSLPTLGAAVVCIPIGILCDMIGRKYSMLLLVIPFTVGWLLLIFANSVVMFYIGRFITGVSGGAFCVTAPMYSAEIAEPKVRGTLGTAYQLLITVGILLTYILGIFINMRILSIISAIVPLIFFAVFVFMPDSPIYYLKKGNIDAARKSLLRLRGSGYNVENELQSQQKELEEASKNKTNFFTALRSKATLKGCIVTYGLMLFQQLSGVNAVVFYTTTIFEKAGSELKATYATVIVGAIQFLAVVVSATIVDRLGRRILLIVSIIFLCITSFIMGIYFYLSEISYDVTSITWLPLASLCIFMIMFNIGFGPIPWLMVSELFPPEVKGTVGGGACLLNWLMAFVVTKFFTNMNYALNVSGTFWLFSAFSAIGIFFVCILIPETKGKSLEEIQRELNGS